jgi:hypothetical protein
VVVMGHFIVIDSFAWYLRKPFQTVGMNEFLWQKNVDELYPFRQDIFW